MLSQYFKHSLLTGRSCNAKLVVASWLLAGMMLVPGCGSANNTQNEARDARADKQVPTDAATATDPPESSIDRDKPTPDRSDLSRQNDKGGQPDLSPVIHAQRPDLGIAGNKAPEWGVNTWINVSSDKGAPSLKKHRGDVIYILGFQTWCSGCHRYGFPTLKKLINRYRGNDDLHFMAIQTAFEGFSTNDLGGARQTARRYGLSIPVGHSGAKGRRSPFMEQYRTGGTPWVIVIGRKGYVRFNGFHIPAKRATDLLDTLLAENSPHEAGK